MFIDKLTSIQLNQIKKSYNQDDYEFLDKFWTRKMENYGRQAIIDALLSDIHAKKSEAETFLKSFMEFLERKDA